MNMLKQSSPRQGSRSPMPFGARLTPPSPLHYTGASTPGSPPTTQLQHQHLGSTTVPQTSSHLLLQMGGENSAFKSLAPPSAAALLSASMSNYVDHSSDDSDEEINVNDESDDDRERSRSSSPLEVVDLPGQKESSACQPLQLTIHDRE